MANVMPWEVTENACEELWPLCTPFHYKKIAKLQLIDSFLLRKTLTHRLRAQLFHDKTVKIYWHFVKSALSIKYPSHEKTLNIPNYLMLYSHCHYDIHKVAEFNYKCNYNCN